jgi:hypothetical protein
MFSDHIRCSFLTACLLGAVAVCGTGPVHAATDAVVRTTQQGLHSWKLQSGKLFMVASTYQDTVTYRRSMSFYYQSSGQSEWQQVPIVESQVDLTTAWTSASRDETTLRDAVVVPRGKNVYLVIANRLVDKPTIAVSRYKFALDSDDFPDGPSALFVPLSTASYQLANVKSIEAVLDKEMSALPKN